MPLHDQPESVGTDLQAGTADPADVLAVSEMNPPASGQEPTDEEFRAAGFTANARNCPLSLAGQKIIAQHNGVRVDQLLSAHRYSSNALMHAWIEALGVADSPRHESGRWLLPKELGIP